MTYTPYIGLNTMTYTPYIGLNTNYDIHPIHRPKHEL